MKSAGLDTCVVLRLLTGEPEKQAQQAMNFIEDSFNGGVQVCVCDMVIAEAYHALIYHYEIPKNKALRALKDFLNSPMITSTGHAQAVLADYKGTGAGFVDRLIRMDLLNHAHQIVTFDRSFARLDNVNLL